MPSNHLILLSFPSPASAFPASGSFPRSQFFASGGQSTGVSASPSVVKWLHPFTGKPVNIQDSFPWGLTGLISLQSKGLSKSFLQHHSSKASILRRLALWSNSHIHTWLLEKPYLWLDRLLSVISLFNLLSGLQQSPSAVTLEPKKIVYHCYPCFSICLPRSNGTGGHDLLFFQCWVLRQRFHSRLSLSVRDSLVFASCHQNGVICISEFISPGNLDSRMVFHMMYSTH